MADILTIDGVAMPAPSSMDYSLSDINGPSAGRNMKGKMILDFVATKRKLSVTWSGLNANDMQTILNALRTSTTGPVHDVTFINPRTKALSTVKMYAGDRTTSIYTIPGGTISKALYKSLAVDFVEI